MMLLYSLKHCANFFDIIHNKKLLLLFFVAQNDSVNECDARDDAICTKARDKKIEIVLYPAFAFCATIVAPHACTIRFLLSRITTVIFRQLKFIRQGI